MCLFQQFQGLHGRALVVVNMNYFRASGTCARLISHFACTWKLESCLIETVPETALFGRFCHRSNLFKPFKYFLVNKKNTSWSTYFEVLQVLQQDFILGLFLMFRIYTSHCVDFRKLFKTGDLVVLAYRIIWIRKYNLKYFPLNNLLLWRASLLWSSTVVNKNLVHLT